jgi:hypothetical protein
VETLLQSESEPWSTEGNPRMKPCPLPAALALWLLAASTAPGEVRYVNLNCTTPTPPYTNWATAATNIQDAVDAAVAGDEILVTNGVYLAGGRAVYGMTNRVAVIRPVTVRSVNGPAQTRIVGYQVPGTTNGPQAVRCVYLTNGAMLAGFTLTRGATQSSGDEAKNQSGGGVWCEGQRPAVSNCVLTGNSASSDGGGAYRARLDNCTITGNHAGFGGAAYTSTLNNCTLSGNTAFISGGGVDSSTLNNCTITGNSAYYGGGAYSCTLKNCILYYNRARDGGPNYSVGSLDYCCTTPLPAGTGNVAEEPQMASASHLGASSPCRAAGSAAYARGLDVDGEPWADSPAIGCDEYWSGAVTGALNVAIVAAYTNVSVGFPVDFQALIEGRLSASRWDFGDGIVVSNRPWASHKWEVPGDYSVELQAYNETHPAGVSATFVVHVLEDNHYVALDSTNSIPPYSSWSTAATNIQDAVDMALPGGVVWVGDGIYQAGAVAIGGASNRVAVTQLVTVRSFHGPAQAQIVGSGLIGPNAVRCVYLTCGAALVGFTLTNGASQYGGGVWCEGSDSVVSNCTLRGNSSSYGGGGAYSGTLINCTLSGNYSDNQGGGAFGSTLNNCALTANSARYPGGGASSATLNNCTITGNSAWAGGGVAGCTLNNCIVYYNTARYGDANYAGCTLSYCCSTPLPPGLGNLDQEPKLAGPSHLSAGSACIDRSNPAFATGVDLDGEPWASLPSIGCDEYWSGSVTGAIGVAIQALYTNVAVGFPVDLQALIEGRVSMSHWDFGDGSAVSNHPWVSHAWTTAGDYVVELRAYNNTYPGGVAATVTVHVVLQPTHYVALNSTNPVPPYASWATAATNIQDAVDAALPGALVWVGDGVYQAGLVVIDGETNRVAVTRPVTVRSFSGPDATHILGFRGLGGVQVRCVYMTNGAVLSGFTLTNGATALGGNGAGVFCWSTNAVVTNCVLIGNYSPASGGAVVGGTLNDCTLADNYAGFGGGAYVATLNGCVLTNNRASQDGGGAFTCALNHCTLTGNSAIYSGGGAWRCSLDHCALINNLAPYGTSFEGGGGAYESTLNYCTLSGNSGYDGGGAIFSTLTFCALSGNSGRLGGAARLSTLNNCTLTANSAYDGGGAYGCALTNCTAVGNSASRYGGGTWGCIMDNSIVYYNSAQTDGSNDGGTVNYCCTTLLAPGTGNLSSEPSFVNTNGWMNLRLQANSPCINAGLNAAAPPGLDLDGSPRIVAGTVDIGAYEFQSPSSVLSYAWAQQYGLPTDGSADFTDPDGDGLNNFQEAITGTVPTNAASALRLLNPSNGVLGVVVSWQSVSNRTYFLERAGNLGVQSPFSLLTSNITGQAGTTSFTDTNVIGPGPFFYRVGVQP